jgi:ankyrin repeat protein
MLRQKENTDILSLLLEHDVDVDSRGADGATSLHWASNFGNLSAGQWLLDHGADINPGDEKGFAPLFDAAGREYVEFAQMLLERGAVIHARDNEGTSLSWAVDWGFIPVVRLLLKHGADVNARDNSGGKVPSQHTVQQEILDLHSEHGAGSVK